MDPYFPLGSIKQLLHGALLTNKHLCPISLPGGQTQPAPKCRPSQGKCNSECVRITQKPRPGPDPPSSQYLLAGDPSVGLSVTLPLPLSLLCVPVTLKSPHPQWCPSSSQNHLSPKGQPHLTAPMFNLPQGPMGPCYLSTLTATAHFHSLGSIF